MGWSCTSSVCNNCELDRPLCYNPQTLEYKCPDCQSRVLPCPSCASLISYSPDKSAKVAIAICCAYCGFLSIQNEGLMRFLELPRISFREVQNIQVAANEKEVLRVSNVKCGREETGNRKRKRLDVNEINPEEKAALNQKLQAIQYVEYEKLAKEKLKTQWGKKYARFGEVHLKWLKSMYDINEEDTIAHSQVDAFWASIELFLLEQPKILALKKSMISSSRRYLSITKIIDKVENPSLSSAVVQNQLKELWRSDSKKFISQSEPFLRFLGCINQHVRGLYDQSVMLLHRIQTYQDNASGFVNLQIVNNTNQEISPKRRNSHHQRQKRCSVPLSTHSTNLPKEFNCRYVELKKKIELWHRLCLSVSQLCHYDEEDILHDK